MKVGGVVLSACFVAAVAATGGAGLSEVKTVYVMPMRNGLDQHLANRIAKQGVFEVVADPKKADAVMTDRLGAAFEAKLNELVPPPPEPAPKQAAPAKEEPKKDESAGAPGLGETKSTGAVPYSSFGGTKGTVFLVSVASRSVVWSTYKRPKSARPGDLDSAARDVAKELQEAVAPKKK